MKIGVSIPYDYFFVPPSTPGGAALRSNCGEPGRLLAILAEMGVASIELRGLAPEYGMKELPAVAATISAHGLEMSCHTAFPQLGGVSEDEYFRHLATLAGSVPIPVGGRLVLVVHSCSGGGRSADELFRATAEIFTRSAKFIRRERLPLRIALELNRGNPQTGPGYTYESLLRLRSETGGMEEETGFCWDFGHACSNWRKGLITLSAPEEFSTAVIHTHIHGVSSGDVTHCALTTENLPLGEFAAQLLRTGYSGVWNFELNPERVISQMDFGAAICRGIGLLRTAFRRIGSSG